MEPQNHISPSNNHILIIPTPGMGHLIPLIQLAKRILQLTSFHISFIIPTERPPTQAQKGALAALLEEKTSYFFLPPVNLDDVPSDAMIETRLSLTLSRSLPALRSHLKESKHRFVTLIVDLFGTDAFEIASEFGISPYIFFPSTAMCLSLFLHLPYLDEKVLCEYRDMQEPVLLPGCTPVHGKDLLDPVQDRKNEAYKWVLHHTKRYTLAEAIMVNTFNELEEGALNFLQKNESGKPMVYPVGPLVQIGSGDDKVDESGALNWLDEQPRGSVLFVSFGSGGTLSYKQIVELAHGLEMSDQRFLWVLRSPNDEILNVTYFSTEVDKKNPLDYLPKGFLERTKERGLVIPLWAPQMKILSHPSTGGFLTHCGWNSILESVVNGVPLIAWPLYAEQKMNAVLITDGMKVALRPNSDENGLVGRGEIGMVVKGLMEGEEGKKIRNRMKELKDASIKVVGEDGSSTKSFLEVAQKWKSSK
ncbi:hydroquinone glucosyltransferase [Amaranthus tricolor]|uniref:hydroquinone glucosyltransferase n=1 Tax=Amaranthus tricolor TaxID=29722 RepID=UPI0025907054|nr:hydroquinone glucosyltransferase [Amaranthus tricolor]